MTQNEFIFKAKIAHGNRGDYSNVVYKSYNNLVKIVCREHGEFEQIAANHLQNFGCKQCSKLIKSEKLTHTSTQFIMKSKEIHGDTYNYDKVIYIGNRNTVIITCSIHGDFEQTADNHIRGADCPKCFGPISKSSIKWLNVLDIKLREQKINGFKVDGFDPQTNTVYEFLGDYWHGNPKKFDLNNLNLRVKKTFGELYEITKNRFQSLIDNSYIVKYVWEKDFRLWEKNKNLDIPIKNYNSNDNL